MNRREFTQWILASGAAGLAPYSWVSANAASAGDTLNAILQPEPPLLNPAINQQTPTQTLCSKIYLSLLTYDFNLNPLPSLAKSWEISSDGKVYTFHLEPNATWHDGKPLTADDVVYTATEFLPPVHPRAKGLFGQCSSIVATDPHTVVFTLKAPFGPFINAFDVGTMPVMPKHIYAGTDTIKNPANLSPIGSGPYKFVKWVRGSYIQLARNENYFKPGLPHLDALIYHIIPDGASRAVALEEGTVQLTQWTDLEYFDALRLSKNPKFVETSKGYEYFSPILWMEINCRTAPLNDKRFRQAVMYAIDREFIRKNILYGFGKVATGPINSNTKFYDSNVKKYDFSVDKANALLDEMGLKRGADGMRTKPLSLPVAPYGEMPRRACEFIRQCLAKVGINVVLDSVDVAGYAQRISNWQFDLDLIWLYQYGDPALGVTRNYVSSNIRKILFTNTEGYVNPEVDRLADAAAAEMDPKKRQALYTQMQQILVEDVPIAWLVEMQFPTIYDKRLQNVVTTALGVNDSFDNVKFST